MNRLITDGVDNRHRSIRPIESQGDKRVKANNMASFQTLQRSRVLVCFDSRASKPPSWLAARGFAFQDDLHLPIDPAGTGTNGYKVYAKTFIEGAEVCVCLCVFPRYN